MKKQFTASDVARWLESRSEALERATRRVRQGRIDKGRELSTLSRRHELMGLTRIAEGEYGKALGHFGAAADAWAVLFERKIGGDAIADEVVNLAMSRPISFSIMADDASCLLRVVDNYSLVWPEGSDRVWYAEIAYHEFAGDHEMVEERLDDVPQDVPESALEWHRALLDKDLSLFRKSLAESVEMWKMRVRAEALGRHPDAVCEHFHINWIRRWMKMWDEIPDVDLEAARIPREIFDVVPERIPLGI